MVKYLYYRAAEALAWLLYGPKSLSLKQISRKKQKAWAEFRRF